LEGGESANAPAPIRLTELGSAPQPPGIVPDLSFRVSGAIFPSPEERKRRDEVFLAVLDAGSLRH